jgi:hypothetical protein
MESTHSNGEASMAVAVYKLFLAKPTEAWHRLPQGEQEDLRGKVNKALEEVGGKRTILCNSEWCSERWPFFGVEEFPSIEAQQRHTELLSEFNWGRYLDSLTVLGTEWKFE